VEEDLEKEAAKPQKYEKMRQKLMYKREFSVCRQGFGLLKLYVESIRS